MIRTNREYKNTLASIASVERAIVLEQNEFRNLGYSADEVDMATSGMCNLLDDMKVEVSNYEALKRGELPRLHSLGDIGRVLIQIRIAKGLTQRKFADLMGVKEAQVSRDERHEYQGVTIKRAQQILERLGVCLPEIGLVDVATNTQTATKVWSQDVELAVTSILSKAALNSRYDVEVKNVRKTSEIKNENQFIVNRDACVLNAV